MNAMPQRPSPPKLAGSRVVVAGARASGLAMARFLLSRQAAVVLTDVRLPQRPGVPEPSESAAVAGVDVLDSP